MCGFAGSWQAAGQGAEALQALGNRMAEAIALRGPDDHGVFVDEALGLSMAFRRLAILDLSVEGHQPKASSSGRYVITFNGEIYNFQELRRRLEAMGSTFKGHSDTEVILEGVERWGVRETITRLNGMFAIALWDTQERILHIARDPLGIKPLYIGTQNGLLLWGSELKALRAHPAFHPALDPDAMELYFRHGFVPSPCSIYQGVMKLAPGCMVSIARPDAPLEPFAYRTLKDVVDQGLSDPFRGTDEEAIQLVESTLRDCVGRQMASDVPLGAFLSGGIDSSLIVSLMQAQSGRPIQTFCIGFAEDHFNEATHARAVANHLGTDHSELIVSPQDALGLIPGLAEIYDEPFADPAMIPTCLVSKLAREKVTVSLSGDGGDEVFAGYGHHISAHEGRLASALALPSGLRHAAGLGCSGMSSLLNLLPGQFAARASDSLAYRARNYGFQNSVSYYRAQVADQLGRGNGLLKSPREPRYVLNEPLPMKQSGTVAEDFLYLDSMMILPDEYLTKVDRAAMSVSLEGRVPFLDDEAVALAWRLPMHLKVRGGQGKWVLRQVLKRHVPAEIIDRPKHGFSVPIEAWLRGPLRAWGEELLQAKQPGTEDLFAVGVVERLWEEHQRGVRSHAVLLWKILMFKAWYARWCA